MSVSLPDCPPVPIPDSLRSCPPVILTAHGSVDPRSSDTCEAVAREVRLLRPGVDVLLGFCENSEPNLSDVLADVAGPAVVAPLLLASAYHARVDIPRIVADSGREDITVADTLGEDPRLVEVLAQRLVEAGAEHSDSTGVLIVAVGSSHAEANARTATLAHALPGRWGPVSVAYATGPEPSVAAGIAQLRERGAHGIVLAPWFIAPGKITDRVAEIAAAHGVSMAAPLGAHPLLAQCVLDRFDAVVAKRLAA